MKPRYPLLLERGGHRPQLLEKTLQLLNVTFVQNPGFAGRFIGAVRKQVPAAKDQVIEIGQWHEIFDQGNPLFRALPQAYRAHLGE